mmetsp:Transcript_106044/g.204081  ORF Transcript_106044/g.204081 Transcript_106044/m.204081 type:complete len:446 (-) Transcript_106044:76-1413(-)
MQELAIGSPSKPAVLRRLLSVMSRGPAALFMRNPVLLLLALRVIEALFSWLRHRRRLFVGWQRVICNTNEIDTELIQGCLLSTEHLLELGRIEKRTLFSRPLLEVLGGNEYLRRELLRAAQTCRQRSRNCLVTRWLRADEKYHVLQDCLNAVSSLFGPNFVHFNALGGDKSEQFKSTWYCLTVTTPTRPEKRQSVPQRRLSSRFNELCVPSPNNTCTFTDMNRTPRATLRVVLVNESELRRIADGKLRQPGWGFFNTRHAERYRMLEDFARNFQKQLVRTSPDRKSQNDERNPFSSEKVNPAKTERPDGGLMKRVQSVPDMKQTSKLKKGSMSQCDSSGDLTGLMNGNGSQPQKSNAAILKEEEDGGSENNCFLRLHVPHYVMDNPALGTSSQRANALFPQRSMTSSSSMGSVFGPSEVEEAKSLPSLTSMSAQTSKVAGRRSLP